MTIKTISFIDNDNIKLQCKCECWEKMEYKQKHDYSLRYNTRDRIKVLAGSAKGRNATILLFLFYSFYLNL